MKLSANPHGIPDFSAEEYARWSELLERRTGITVPRERQSFLQTKIWSRMSELGLTSFADYWDLVTQQGIDSRVEWAQLVDRLTVHETSFFRHRPSYELVEEQLKQAFSQAQDILHYRIWSVSCATGEEAWSLAMLADQCASSQGDKKIYYGVIGTDVSRPAISLAQQGIYDRHYLESVPASMSHYFQSAGNGLVRIADSLRKRVAFGYFNLLDLEAAAKVRYDLIYCHNVLIYFSRETRLKILDNLVRYLKKDGILVLGPTDISAWQHPKMVRLPARRTLSYQLKNDV
jgi:chemotaxis protein methyltransferase CheR/type IV pilus assembly protein PilK